MLGSENVAGDGHLTTRHAQPVFLPVQQDVPQSRLTLCHSHGPQQYGQRRFIPFLFLRECSQGDAQQTILTVSDLLGQPWGRLWISFSMTQGQNQRAQGNPFDLILCSGVLRCVQQIGEAGVGTQINVPLVMQGVPEFRCGGAGQVTQQFWEVFWCAVSAAQSGPAGIVQLKAIHDLSVGVLFTPGGGG